MKHKIELYATIIYIVYVVLAGVSVSVWGFGLASLVVLTFGGMLATTFAFLIMSVSEKKD